MKLIIKEYLASLKERGELDALLPDLLLQMGLRVISKPSIGPRQYGVDIAAVGKIDKKPETVYLFSIKQGDLNRQSWNSGSPQDMQPSLDDILTVYIPTHLPKRYRLMPIEICICIGGEIKQEIQLNVTQYKEQKDNSSITISIWDSGFLTEKIDNYLLREELLPKNYRSALRKSLALLDEPDISFKHFSHLINTLVKCKTGMGKKDIRLIRQLYISLWILFAWCREANNLESAYLASELTLLNSWEICKPYFGKNIKVALDINKTLISINFLYSLICNHYLENKILPYTNRLHALSNGVKPSCKVDVNLKLFDILGRVAINGVWIYWLWQRTPKEESDLIQYYNIQIQNYSLAIKQLINNNPILLSPYKDEQIIDITIAVWFLALNPQNDKYISSWLSELTARIENSFYFNSKYPCILKHYYELIENPTENTEAYREEITAGSVLYPTISALSSILKLDDVYTKIQILKKEFIKHCNFQLWYPDETTETHFYINDSNHGAVLSHVCIEKSQKELLDQIFKECKEAPHFDNLSAIKYGEWPLIFVACRHYRLPLPVQFLKMLHPR